MRRPKTPRPTPYVPPCAKTIDDPIEYWANGSDGYFPFLRGWLDANGTPVIHWLEPSSGDWKEESEAEMLKDLLA